MAGSDFLSTLEKTGFDFSPVSVDTLWLNITKRCNQTCRHCHVDASPDSKDQMSRATIEKCLEVAANLDSCENLDITGGAPELHPDFEYMVRAAGEIGKKVTVRHNLTITVDGDLVSGASKEHLPYFFAENGVVLLASLPFCTEPETDGVRGIGVFGKSIQVLSMLNAIGYGRYGSGLELNLVCNRDGAVSPITKERLESQFRETLAVQHGVHFNSLLTVTNMPIGRFLGEYGGNGGAYIDSLGDNFSDRSIADLVCRHRVSVGHDGLLYDCDFNQMLGLGLSGGSASIYDFDLESLINRKIRFGSHCFGCTAGGGSN
jgi:radical SAM/Cys-rich protein